MTLAIPHMLGLPPPPPPAKHVRCFSQLKLFLGHSVQLPSVWKSIYSKIGPKLAESYLCNETSDRQTKICLRNFISFLFFHILCLFEFKLGCKSCVQLTILIKTRISQTLRCHIFVTKHSTDKVKHVLEMSILARFFKFFTFWI